MGSGYRVFTAGEVLTASNVQNYLQDQAVMVFGGTAARSSAIGTANFEEGMLTYLTDVDKLQVYTGAAFADVYPAAASNQGLTLINSTTATGAIGSISINDVFSSTYKNYFITISPTGNNGNVVLYFRLRASGTDNTSSYGYVTRNFYFSDGSATTVGNANSTSFIGLGYPTGQSNGLAMSLNVFNPYVAVRTSVFGQGVGASPTDNSYALTNVGGAHSDAGLFDGFSLVRASGTGMELIIKTYGMAN